MCWLGCIPPRREKGPTLGVSTTLACIRAAPRIIVVVAVVGVDVDVDGGVFVIVGSAGVNEDFVVGGDVGVVGVVVGAAVVVDAAGDVAVAVDVCARDGADVDGVCV